MVNCVCVCVCGFIEAPSVNMNKQLSRVFTVLFIGHRIS